MVQEGDLGNPVTGGETRFEPEVNPSLPSEEEEEKEEEEMLETEAVSRREAK